MNNDMNSTFWISFVSIITGVMVISIKYCLKSKCDNVDICGLIKIHRNTEEETKLEEEQMRIRPQPSGELSV